MCWLCDDKVGDRTEIQRAHVLQLLALLEHPDALPADAALHLSQKIMMLLRPEPGLRWCEAVTPPRPDVERTR